MKKKVITCLLSGIIACQFMVSPVYAASSETGTLDGHTCRGTVVYSRTSSGDCNGVTASTTFSVGGSLKATATVYYKYGGIKYTSSVSDGASGLGVSATAKTNDIGTVYGGKGVHHVTYGAYSWDTTTTIGTTW